MMTVSLSDTTGHGGVVADAGNKRLQSGLAAKLCFDQVRQFSQEVNNIHRLRCNQSRIKRQLQPSGLQR
jgi:hypothetical protein